MESNCTKILIKNIKKRCVTLPLNSLQRGMTLPFWCSLSPMTLPSEAPALPPRKNEPSLKEMKKATQEFQKHWEVYLCVVWNANCSFTFANHSKESQKAKEAHPLAAFIQLAIGRVPLFSTLLINQISIYHWFCKSVRKSFLWWSPPITTPNPSKEENVPESGQNCSKKITI